MPRSFAIQAGPRRRPPSGLSVRDRFRTAGRRLGALARHVLGALGRRQVAVVVRPRSVIVHNGRTYGEGETVRLPAAEVRGLEEQGIVSRPERAPSPR